MYVLYTATILIMLKHYMVYLIESIVYIAYDIHLLLPSVVNDSLSECNLRSTSGSSIRL